MELIIDIISSVKYGTDDVRIAIYLLSRSVVSIMARVFTLIHRGGCSLISKGTIGRVKSHIPSLHCVLCQMELHHFNNTLTVSREGYLGGIEQAICHMEM